jgi:hypothetical protein
MLLASPRGSSRMIQLNHTWVEQRFTERSSAA